MSGQQLADGAVDAASASSAAAGGSGGDRNPVDGKSSTSIAKQHSYEQIDHAHFLANDIGTLYLNDRLDYRQLYWLMFQTFGVRQILLFTIFCLLFTKC